MSDWTSGYVADIGYTFGYYMELNPLRAKLAFLNAGIVPPKMGTHCELGFGQGLSVNIHAASSGSEWHATDFNPAQAGFAQELAAVSGNSAKLYDQSFEEFCVREDLPEFDSIGLHGIWSWINDDNRAVIVDFIRRKLKVGGVLYISYNTQPGWAAMVPMRDLLTEHAEVMGVPGQGIVNRIDAALLFADKLLATNPTYAKANSLVPERLQKLKEQNRNYLAHEYFNRDWLPMPFSKMGQWLAPTKLSYACSANYLDHVDTLNLTGEQQALLSEIPDTMFRQTVRDFCVNQQFRRDYWVKGARRLNAAEQVALLRKEAVVLTQHRSDVSLKVSGALGSATMQEFLYGPILEVLADNLPKTLWEIEQAVSKQLPGNTTFAQVLQAVMVLSGAGVLAGVQDSELAQNARQNSERLNRYLIEKSQSSSEINFLASPVTGSGIAVSRFQQLFLLALSQGKKSSDEWAEFAWAIVSSQGQRLVKDGKTLDLAEENLSELTAQAKEFQEKRLPILKALQVI